MHTSTTTDTRNSTIDNDRYSEFLAAQRARFAGVSGPLFITDADAEALWAAYLDAAPEGSRQSRTCHCCRRFVERFGGLVTIDAAGEQSSPLWYPETAPPAYRAAADALAKVVRRSRISTVFLAPGPTWGVPVTGDWTHLAVQPNGSAWRGDELSARQKMAEKREEFGMLQRSLADYPIDIVRKASALLDGGSLYRGEKHAAMARWLLDLHEARGPLKGRARDNVVWRAVAAAPPGWCHVRTGLLGTLLDDVASGLDGDEITRRHAAKMNPLLYQRPQAAPSAGQVAAAEKLFESLGLAPALERRFARLADVQALWTPRQSDAKPAGGVFGHLLQKERVPLDTGNPVPITWSKFAQTVLPSIESIDVLVPQHGDFCAFVTAHADAPPILQWDRLEKRNAVSWYVYHGGSDARLWRLAPGWAAVRAVVLKPTLWDADRSYAHHGPGVLFAIDGCRDTRSAGAGLGMFPEILRSELHGVRATIEAHSRSRSVADAESAEVCGLIGPPADVRVTSRGVRTRYRIDRWD